MLPIAHTAQFRPILIYCSFSFFSPPCNFALSISTITMYVYSLAGGVARGWPARLLCMHVLEAFGKVHTSYCMQNCSQKPLAWLPGYKTWRIVRWGEDSEPSNITRGDMRALMRRSLTCWVFFCWPAPGWWDLPVPVQNSYPILFCSLAHECIYMIYAGHKPNVISSVCTASRGGKYYSNRDLTQLGLAIILMLAPIPLTEAPSSLEGPLHALRSIHPSLLFHHQAVVWRRRIRSRCRATELLDTHLRHERRVATLTKCTCARLKVNTM